MYDVMAVDRLRRSPLGRRRIRDRNQDGQEDWSPARHRVVDGEEVRELLPALAPREPTGGYLFYDCQTDDVRLVLTVLGEAERFGAVFANGLEVTGLVEEDGRARGARVRDVESGEEFPVRAPGGRQRHRRVGRPHPPRRAARRGRGAGHPPQPRHPHHPARASGCRSRSARSSPPPTAARSSSCRGSARR